MASVDKAIFQRTRDTLGKVIKKPPLTDKLLSRPPFRYLHDIIAELTKGTGFFKGLYTPQELDAKSIQDKDAKTEFLQKAIDTLSFTNGELVRVKPSKIVAGHEVEKTNEFLQMLAIAILKESDSSEAVQRVLNGEKPSESLTKEKKRRDKGGSKEDDSSKRRSRSKERSEEGRKHSGGGSSTRKQRDSSKEAADNPASLRSKSHRNLKEKQAERPTHRPSRTRPPPESEATPQDDKHGESSNGNQVEDRVKDNVDDEGLGSETLLDRPPSAKGSRKRPPLDTEKTGSMLNGTHTSTTTTATALPEDSGDIPESHDTDMTTAIEAVTATQSPSPPLPQSMVLAMKRPNSARPAPPKIVKTSASLEDVSVKVPSTDLAGEAVPPLVILDTPGEDNELGDDDDDQFVVEDSTHLIPPPSEAFMNSVEGVPGMAKPEGALTKNIVAMKQRLEGDLAQSVGQQQSDQPTISEAQRRKEREMVAREIEKLQTSIQTLCKSANPLGKIMDYVQEDMDSMQKELETWRQENERHNESLRKEQSITEQELSPLRSQLEELETRIKEQVDLISTTKANILKNEDKIHQLLNSMAFAS